MTATLPNKWNRRLNVRSPMAVPIWMESCTVFMKSREKPNLLHLLIRRLWISPIAPICMQLATRLSSFLAMAQGVYMSRDENLILVGNPGLGKTHLGIGLALAACRQGKRVRFYKTAALINDLQMAQKKLTLSGFVARFAKLDLLVLDELGFFPVDKSGGLILYQLVSDFNELVLHIFS